VAWGTVELEAEVASWVEALPAREFGRVEFYIDLPAERGPLLDEPFTRQLRGKLRELRFYLGARGDAVRLSYFIASGRRIILLTVFRKQRRREQAEIERAYRARDGASRSAMKRNKAVSRPRSWAGIKRARSASEEQRGGYQEAKAAFELAERVREARQRLGVTQAELAARIGSTQPAIARLEAGGVTPSLVTLRSIAAALGLELIVELRARPAA
jgi:ribosome-binding protein aMBF1 (putative translation factor)